MSDQDHGNGQLKGGAALAALEARGELFGFPADVADVFGKDLKTVYRALENGEIPHTRIGQRYQISTAWMRRQVDGADAPQQARRAS
jgi:excisionase family DNA binding protein